MRAALLALLLAGCASHEYVWDPGWLQVPGELGSTHGEILVADDGRVILSTDSERAIMVVSPDGRLLQAWGAEFAGGVHGMCLAGDELLFVHFGRHEWVRATLDGDILERHGAPLESGHYASAEQFRPTSIAVAPDGMLFVADGYGTHWIHRYDAEGSYLSSFGGPAELDTPHGVWVDTRREPHRLLVADREHHRVLAYGLDGTWLGVVAAAPDLRRPCKIQERDGHLVVPDLCGRVTILGPDDRVVAQLGDNPDESQWADYDVPREAWRDGIFTAPHSAAWDASGNLYVMDWNRFGRVNRLVRLR